MSLPPSLNPFSRQLDSLPTAAAHLLISARGLAFWTAIALPFGYLPLFTFDAVSLSLETFAFLLLINVVALIVGHPYHR